MPRQCSSSSLGVNLSRTGQCAEYPLYRDVSRTNTKEFMQQSGVARRAPERTGAAVEAGADGAAQGSRRRPSWRALPLHPGRVVGDGTFEDHWRLRRACHRAAGPVLSRSHRALAPHADPERMGGLRAVSAVRPDPTPTSITDGIPGVDPCRPLHGIITAPPRPASLRSDCRSASPECAVRPLHRQVRHRQARPGGRAT